MYLHIVHVSDRRIAAEVISTVNGLHALMMLHFCEPQSSKFQSNRPSCSGRVVAARKLHARTQVAPVCRGPNVGNVTEPPQFWTWSQATSLLNGSCADIYPITQTLPSPSPALSPAQTPKPSPVNPPASVSSTSQPASSSGASTGAIVGGVVGGVVGAALVVVLVTLLLLKRRTASHERGLLDSKTGTSSYWTSPTREDSTDYKCHRVSL